MFVLFKYKKNIEFLTYIDKMQLISIISQVYDIIKALNFFFKAQILELFFITYKFPKMLCFELYLTFCNCFLCHFVLFIFCNLFKFVLATKLAFCISKLVEYKHVLLFV